MAQNLRKIKTTLAVRIIRKTKRKRRNIKKDLASKQQNFHDPNFKDIDDSDVDDSDDSDGDSDADIDGPQGKIGIGGKRGIDVESPEIKDTVNKPDLYVSGSSNVKLAERDIKSRSTRCWR